MLNTEVLVELWKITENTGSRKIPLAETLSQTGINPLIFILSRFSMSTFHNHYYRNTVHKEELLFVCHKAINADSET